MRSRDRKLREKTGKVKGQEIEEKDGKSRNRRLREKAGKVKGQEIEESDG